MSTHNEPTAEDPPRHRGWLREQLGANGLTVLDAAKSALASPAAAPAAAVEGPCPDGESCPDARHHGHTHAKPMAAAPREEPKPWPLRGSAAWMAEVEHRVSALAREVAAMREGGR